MTVDFSALEALIAQTKIEVAEAEVARLALVESMAALSVIQAAIVAAQSAVAAASDSANVENADVVAGINASIALLQELLAQLQ